MPFALPVKFWGDGLFGLGPGVAEEVPVAVELTPDRMTGSIESSAMPLFFIPEAAVALTGGLVGAGLMKLGISL